MIFEKRGKWKSSYGFQKFDTKEEAQEWELEFISVHTVSEPEKVFVETKDTNVKDSWSPLEKLRGWKEKDELDEYEDNLDNCEECGCDPCECEWTSVDET